MINGSAGAFSSIIEAPCKAKYSKKTLHLSFYHGLLGKLS